VKKSLLGITIIVFILFNSCISLQDRQMTTDDLQLKVLGSVEAKFTSFHFLHIQINPAIKKMAYNCLMDEANKKYAATYGADVLDIKNITIVGKSDFYSNILLAWTVFVITMPIAIVTAILCDWQDITAKGTVVINPNKQKVSNNQRSIINVNAFEKAVERIGDTFVGRLPGGSTIAVLSISGTTNASQIIDELEYRLVEKGTDLKIVERRLLAQIRLEQGFQMTGDVSDESAVSIGNMLGANIVITGNITNSGNKQRLTVKALDVKTAQIIAMAREDF